MLRALWEVVKLPFRVLAGDSLDSLDWFVGLFMLLAIVGTIIVGVLLAGGALLLRWFL